MFLSVHFRNGLTCVQVRFVLSVTEIREEAVLAGTATTALNGPRFRYEMRVGGQVVQEAV